MPASFFKVSVTVPLCPFSVITLLPFQTVAGKNSVAMRLHRIRSNPCIEFRITSQQNGQLLILSFRLYAWVYMCSHMCEHIYVLCGKVGVRVGVHPEVFLSCFSVSTHLVFWDGISHSLGLTGAAKLAGQPWGSFCPYRPKAGTTNVCHHGENCYLVLGSNSDPHSCAGSILLTKLSRLRESLQPCKGPCSWVVEKADYCWITPSHRADILTETPGLGLTLSP